MFESVTLKSVAELVRTGKVDERAGCQMLMREVTRCFASRDNKTLDSLVGEVLEFDYRPRLTSTVLRSTFSRRQVLSNWYLALEKVLKNKETTGYYAGLDNEDDVDENTMEMADRSLIFNELLKTATINPYHQITLKDDKESIIREYLTIGLKSGRNTGMTMWLSDFLEFNPKTLFFVPSAKHVDEYKTGRRPFDPESRLIFSESTHRRIFDVQIFNGDYAKENYDLINESDFIFIHHLGDGKMIPDNLMKALVDNFSPERIVVVVG